MSVSHSHFPPPLISDSHSIVSAVMAFIFLFMVIMFSLKYLVSMFSGLASLVIHRIPEVSAKKKYAETSQVKNICRNVSYDMWGISGVCTLALASLRDFRSRCLCSCSTSLSKMGIYAAPRGRGVLEEMGTYPREYGTVCRYPFCRIRQSVPTLPILPNFFFGEVGIEIRQSGHRKSAKWARGWAEIGRRNGIENQS